MSLMRRLPPAKIEQNLSGLLNLLPDDTDELLQRIDQPLQESVDSVSGRNYLQCDYNRDGDSYRSPWSNAYFPPLEDGFLPSEQLRAQEVEANELFDAYRELYYEGGTSSVYLWSTDNGFAGCFLIKKKVSEGKFVEQGCWDSISVVEVHENKADRSRATYKLTCTLMLTMGVNKAEVGNTNLSGSLTRQSEQTLAVTEAKPHLANIGRMIEDMETDMRSNLNQLYILKTRDIVNQLRVNRDGPSNSNAFTMSLNAAVLGHGQTRKQDSEHVSV